MNSYKISVKAKGRSVIPAALRRECGIADGDDLSATPLGHGRLLVESRGALLDELWEGLAETSENGASESLRAWREDSERERRARLDQVVLEPGKSASEDDDVRILAFPSVH